MLYHILEFCEKMGLEAEGQENKVFDFLAPLVATGKKVTSKIDKEEEVGEGGERTMLHEGEH